MIKVYKSHSTISTTIKCGGKKVRISFRPFSHGGGVYSTESPTIQAAIEADPRYGKNFWLALAPKAEKAAEEVKEAKEVEKVEVTDLGEAKQYLADNYGYKKNKLRSIAAIKDAALEHSIEFVGI